MWISFLWGGGMWGVHRPFTAVFVGQLLFICVHYWIQCFLPFPYLLLVFLCVLLLFWLKACITFFLNYVSLCCECYIWQFNSLWTGKLWNDSPLSFGINQLPGFKLIWQKPQWQIWEQSGFESLFFWSLTSPVFYN